MGPKSRRSASGFAAKRRLILDAAIRVFAQRGFNGTRVGDIAKEADIAYGLVYHYFAGKEDLLNTLFQENWAITLKVVEQIDAGGGDLRTKLGAIAGFFLQAWRANPDIVEVIMVEVVRSPKFLEEDNLAAFRRIFDILEAMFQRHRDAGELRETVHPRLTALLFMGSLEILLTGFIAREFLSEDDLVRDGRDALVETFISGLVAR
jgi:AcrR family transcriptional regulator